jgi:hypothetical protein
MFALKFNKNVQKDFHNAKVELPDGYFFKYRMGETTAIHYTSKTLISEEEFNDTTRLIIAKQGLAYSEETLAVLEKKYNSEEEDKKMNYENLPESLKSLCEKRLACEEQMIVFKNQRKDYTLQKKLELYLSEGRHPAHNYYDEINKHYVFNRMTFCEYREHVDYKNNKNEAIYNAVVVKELIAELTKN